MDRIRTLILGAAGRDFHDFNVLFRDDPAYQVVAFTAQQIPHIADRTYPAELAGPSYPGGIPIVPESRLEETIATHHVDLCVMAYSDVAHVDVMHLASRANAAGAAFQLPAPRQTMLKSVLPVVAVCASRTGAGKSPTSRLVADLLRKHRLRVSILRHPMPYGDLAGQRVQRFASSEDLVRHRVTIEEREEYEGHLASGSVVWAGVDYQAILAEVEREADILIWDGGNNDTSFLQADVYLTVVDPHRPGDEVNFHPGETNLRLADVVLINKVDTADPAAVLRVRNNIDRVNPRATVLEADSPIEVSDPELLPGRRVVVIEDGPTLTHGGMGYGAGVLAARRFGALPIDPRRFAVGEIAETFRAFPHLENVLPAMGYGARQIRDLEATLNAVAEEADAVVVGTPIDLARLVRLPLPYTRVRYSVRPRSPDALEAALRPAVERALERHTIDVLC